MFLTFLPIISVLIVLFIFLILSNHSFHYFHTTFEGCRVSTSFGFLLGSFLLMMMVLLVLLLFILFLLSFELFNISVPYFPLSDFAPQIVSNWWLCCSSSFLNVRINRLDLPSLIVELVSHRLLDGLDIFARTRLLLFSLSSELLEIFLSVQLNFFLDLVLIVGSMNVVTL